MARPTRRRLCSSLESARRKRSSTGFSDFPKEACASSTVPISEKCWPHWHSEPTRNGGVKLSRVKNRQSTSISEIPTFTLRKARQHIASDQNAMHFVGSVGN